MEFLFTPANHGNPATSAPRTPYASLQRYDGGPWKSYPARNGLTAREGYTDEVFDIGLYNKSQYLNPTPVTDQEEFVQRWLYFGLLAEFVGVDTSIDLSMNAAANETVGRVQKTNISEILDRIYEAVLVNDGDEIYVRLNRTCLQEFLSAMYEGNNSRSLEAQKAHYEHLISCLEYAYSIVSVLSRDFNHAIKCSINALGELFNRTTNLALATIEVPAVFVGEWSNRFLSDETKILMRASGWCPSDIARAELKYRDVQTFHIARMLDKSLPPKDHNHCNESVCNYYQIDLRCYELQHQQENCSCMKLDVKEELLTDILLKDNQFPILKLVGETHNLGYEIIESGVAPYVAISHVWADGLGNPQANSLFRCKLQHLLSLVEALDNKDNKDGSTTLSQDGNKSLIWLDTLCCPAIDSLGKQTAIEKIRLVYQGAKHVLVLDAGLMAHEAKKLEAAELLMLIFTSGWMRRLWTLQEGALAKSLYFQFADESVSFLQLNEELRRDDMTYQAMYRDVDNELMGLLSFFHSPEPLPGDHALFYLDGALKYRGVSVPSDEPLCISTLMMLDLKKVLEFNDLEQRVRIMWQLLSDKNGGIPALVIFFDYPKLTTSGWKWAPCTLRFLQHGRMTLNTQAVGWVGNKMGTLTPFGLSVQFPGCRVVCRPSYNDQKPRHPWPGLPRVPEHYIQFRDETNGRWYRVMDKECTALAMTWKSNDERQTYNAKEQFPLQDIVDTNRAAFIYSGDAQNKAVLVTIVSEDIVTGDILCDDKSGDVGNGIAVAIQRGVIVTDLGEESHIYDVIKKLALKVRAEAITDDHLELYNSLVVKSGKPVEEATKLVEEHECFKASLRKLKDRMREAVVEEAGTDERFSKLVDKYLGVELDEMWVIIQDFFRHDYLGTSIADGQVWFVD